MRIAKIILAAVLAVFFLVVLFMGMSAITWEFGQWASNYMREWATLLKQLFR